MEHIRKAVERAKGPFADDPILKQEQPRVGPGIGTTSTVHTSAREASLDGAYLESKRIIAHDIGDSRSRSFDMLRTQILQSMDMKSWQFLGITSATEGCGKSVIAVNLALSIARQPERSALLIDLDLRKPQVASYLGLDCDRGVLSVLAGRTNLQSSLIRARIKDQQVLVLPCESATINSSEWITSRSMSDLLQEIQRDFRNWTVIFDLPPILASDDVIAILPRLDCVAFVVGAGTTTVDEIKECNKHLESAEIVRVILNKSEDATATYYSYPRPTNDQTPPTQRRGAPKFKRISRMLTRLSEI